jgi:hypothetical protein
MSCWTGCVEEEVATLECIGCVIQNLLQYAVRLGGVIAFIFLVIGGFKYLTAGGDPKKAQAARNTLTYAVVGVVLLVLIWFIMLFIKEFTGVDVTEVTIGL